MSDKARKAWGWILISLATSMGFGGATVAAWHSYWQEKARRAELEAVTARQNAITALVYSSDYGWVILDELGRVQDWNPAMEQMTGWMKYEMVGETIEKVMDPEIWKRHDAAYMIAINDPNRTRLVQTVECNLIPKGDRDPIRVQVRVQMVRRDGKPYSIGLIDRASSVVELPESSSTSLLKNLVLNKRKSA